MTSTPGYPQSIVPVGHVEPVPRRVRAVLAGTVVLDTTRALYVFEWPNYPQFYVPLDDVSAGVLVDEGTTADNDRGRATRVGLRTGGAERPGSGLRYDESPLDGVAGTVRFAWEAIDAWFEEDEQVFVHPRNPYTRVDALRSSRRVRVERDGVVLAETGAPVLVFETGLPPRFYIPRLDVDFSHLEPSDTVTACPYKGRTSAYWSVRAGDRLVPDLAWSYDFPTRELLAVAGLVAFYDERVDTVVDGQPRARPQTHFFSS